MTSNFEEKLEKYAEVLVKVGLNIQPDQRLVIGPPLSGIMGVDLKTAPLVRLIALKAYQAGARHVEVMWMDTKLELIRLKHAPQDSFDEFPSWRSNGAIETAKAGDALLLLFMPSFELFVDSYAERMAKMRNINMKHMKSFLELRGKCAMNFAIAAAPSDSWAEKVFPDFSPDTRESQLWETIFELCRIDQPDPISAWQQHIADLSARCDYMNKRQYAVLHFTAPGTDLRVGLPDGHVWASGNMTTQNGINFTTNIPTEEIFTTPHKDKVDGVITTTKPGVIIEGMSLEFSNGKVVKATAQKGEDILRKDLETITGFNQLGEVAIVPHSSPISQSGRVFNIILYDENASCHLALGNAYRLSIEGGEEMSDEEFAQAGGNISQNHWDFMIGSEKMDVDGIREDGLAEPIMRGGEWAFDA